VLSIVVITRLVNAWTTSIDSTMHNSTNSSLYNIYHFINTSLHRQVNTSIHQQFIIINIIILFTPLSHHQHNHHHQNIYHIKEVISLHLVQLAFETINHLHLVNQCTMHISISNSTIIHQLIIII